MRLESATFRESFRDSGTWRANAWAHVRANLPRDGDEGDVRAVRQAAVQVTPVPVRTLRDERRGQELLEILAEALRREVQRVVRRDFELEDAPGPRGVAVVVGAPHIRRRLELALAPRPRLGRELDLAASLRRLHVREGRRQSLALGFLREPFRPERVPPRRDAAAFFGRRFFVASRKRRVTQRRLRRRRARLRRIARVGPRHLPAPPALRARLVHPLDQVEPPERVLPVVRRPELREPRVPFPLVKRRRVAQFRQHLLQPPRAVFLLRVPHHLPVLVQHEVHVRDPLRLGRVDIPQDALRREVRGRARPAHHERRAVRPRLAHVRPAHVNRPRVPRARRQPPPGHRGEETRRVVGNQNVPPDVALELERLARVARRPLRPTQTRDERGLGRAERRVVPRQLAAVHAPALDARDGEERTRETAAGATRGTGGRRFGSAAALVARVAFDDLRG